jgi:HEPN domain-containing protein
VSLCTEIDTDFAELLDDCAVVDQYYIPTRYPNGVPGSLPDGLPGSDEAQEAIVIAKRIRDLVNCKLSPE